MGKRLKLKLLIYTILAVILVAVLWWWIAYNQGKTRDYKRLADIKVIQAELTEYYRRFNTYKIPECQGNSLVNFCVGKGDQAVGFQAIIDPLNSGAYQYIVDSLLDNDYIISFSLERGMVGVPAGNYVLTKEGVGK